MKTEFQKIKADLESALDSGVENSSSADALNRAAAFIDVALSSLKAYIVKNGFDDETQEIEFFKVLKPEILSFKIDLIYRYNLKLNEPVGTPETIIKYYESELKSIQSFFRMNSFHYQYFRNNLSNMDSIYFLRNAGPLALPIDDVNDLDPNFSTPMSLLFAKFKGYELIQQFILVQIAMAQKGKTTPATQASKEELRWTGDSINIVELAYGLYLTGQLNNGNASLNQIVRWLEENLNVSIGIIQRRFTEIGSRKRLSQTKYIDQMRDNIIQKLEAGNA